jgi:hypothetical protein
MTAGFSLADVAAAAGSFSGMTGDVAEGAVPTGSGGGFNTGACDALCIAEVAIGGRCLMLSVSPSCKTEGTVTCAEGITAPCQGLSTGCLEYPGDELKAGIQAWVLGGGTLCASLMPGSCK